MIENKRFTLEEFGLNFIVNDNGRNLTAKQTVDRLNELNDENEQLRKDATTLIYANQDYRQQNQNLQEQLDYIQNLISEHIRHQKTELGVKALQEIIVDYNEWILGHKEAKK